MGGVAGVRISYSLSREKESSILNALEDVRDAVRFIQEHAKELNIDPERFGFCGWFGRWSSFCNLRDDYSGNAVGSMLCRSF